MAEPNNALTEVTQGTSQLLHDASEKTTQSVIQHTAKYNDAYATIDSFIAAFWERMPYLLIALIVFTIFVLLAKLFKFFIRKTLNDRSYTKQNLVLVLNRVGSSAIIFIGFLIAMVITIPGFTPGQMMSTLGIGSVAIGFAFKDIFQNLLSGILLLLSEPFRIGDQIVSGEYEGTVEDIKIRATTIRTYDGRQVVIPNSDLYTSALTVNTAYKQRRLQLAVGIGYADDIVEAKSVIMKALDRADSVSKQASPTIIAVNLGDSTIDLVVRWFIDDGNQANKVTSIDQVLIEVKTALDKAGIDMPFPVRTIDLSDPSVKAIVSKINEHQAVDVNKTVTE